MAASNYVLILCGTDAQLVPPVNDIMFAVIKAIPPAAQSVILE